jgi:hypothetical protein
MPDICFTANFPVGHQNIIRHRNRPFATVPEMDDEILARLNACIAETDTSTSWATSAAGRCPLLANYHPLEVHAIVRMA